MVKLEAKSPAEGLLPYINAQTELQEIALGKVTSIAPFAGQSGAVEAALGGALPKAGYSVVQQDNEIIWFSQGQYLLIGSDVPAGVVEIAAITDQSDAWCAISLSGVYAQDVLARLVPVDLRRSHLGAGQVLRSQLGHMPLHLTRTAADGFRVMSFRSMAGTMVHEMTRALDFLAARG